MRMYYTAHISLDNIATESFSPVMVSKSLKQNSIQHSKQGAKLQECC